MSAFRSRQEIEAIEYTGDDASVLEMLRILGERSVEAVWNPKYSGRIEFTNAGRNTSRLMPGDWLQYDAIEDEFIIWGSATLLEKYEQVSS